jgi:predicted phosphoribosyltransferase
MLGRQLNQRIAKPCIVLGITPTGVEIAANVAQAMVCGFDVIVAGHVRVEGHDIIGALAEDADAVMDPSFQPKFSQIDALNDGIDRARRAVKTERLLFRGQRPLRSLEEMNVVIVDAHVTSPWKMIAAGFAAQALGARRVWLAAPAGTQAVQERVRAKKFEFVCPSVLMDAAGHPRPFGDPMDPTAERLRSIVVARQAA